MTTISKVVTTWGGFSGAPGYTVMYCAAPAEQDLVNGLHTFFNTIKGLFLTSQTFDWQAGDVTLDSSSGLVNGAYGGLTVPAQVVGTAGTLAHAGPVGVRIRWRTNTIKNHRVVRGSTILVPVAPGAFNTAGGIDSANLATIQNAAGVLQSNMGANLVVFGRPPHGTHTGGVAAPVTGVDVATYATVRRSRRD